MESERTFHLKAHFSGHVQGVGFRYTVYQIAKGYDVTGYVKNLLDGRVELEVEGEESECRAFLKSIEEEMDSYIRKTESATDHRSPTHSSFVIA